MTEDIKEIELRAESSKEGSKTEERPAILYVDDEPSNLTAFKAAFRRFYNIYTASSGKEALEILKKVNIYIIITDQRMPEMTGVQFLEIVIPQYPDPIRMVLTGFTDVEAIIKAINNGRVLRYITKPWNAEELRQILDDAIRVFRLERKNRELMVQLQRELAKQQTLLNVFQKYVPEHIASEALKYGEEDMPMTESRNLAVLFCDIRKSTNITEKLPPSELVIFLNEYFSVMNRCIIKHKGYVDNFLGDGILALFGAPVAYMDNSQNAVNCAIEMIEVIETMNMNYQKKLNINLAIGIGINSGSVVVGNFGAKERLQYTAIGDVVNVTFRIEDLSHDLDNTIFISRATYEQVKDIVNVEDLGAKVLRGKDAPVNVYKVLSKKEKA